MKCVTLRVMRDDGPDLIVTRDDGSTLQHVCVHAAAVGFMRGHTCEPVAVELVDRHGEPIPRSEWPTCRVPDGEWERRVHHWTHSIELVAR